MEGIEPSILVLAKFSYFADMKKSEMLFGNRIEYALGYLNRKCALQSQLRLNQLFSLNLLLNCSN